MPTGYETVSLHHDDLNYLWNIIKEVRNAVNNPPPHTRFAVTLKWHAASGSWCCAHGDLSACGRTPEAACEAFDKAFYQKASNLVEGL